MKQYKETYKYQMLVHAYNKLAKKADRRMRELEELSKEKGFKIVSQQIRTDNVASIALHSSLGFETNGLVYTNSKGNEVAVYLKSLV